MTSVTAAALANSLLRTTTADATIAADTTGTLDDFHSFAGRSEMIMQVTGDKLCGFNAFASIISTRAYCDWPEQGGLVQPRRTFRELQTETWYQKRCAFEAMWTCGEDFIYGALVAGTLGDTRFGPYGIVIDRPDNADPLELAVFPGNTAELYGHPTHEAAAHDGATLWHDRGALAVVLLAPHVTPDRDTWPSVLFDRKRYLEVVRAGSIPLGEISSMRITTAEYGRIRTLRMRQIARFPLSPTDDNAATFYALIRRWITDYDMRLELLP